MRFRNGERGSVSGKEVWVTISGLVIVERLLVGEEVRLFIDEVQSSRTSIGKNQRTSYNYIFLISYTSARWLVEVELRFSETCWQTSRLNMI
jgi:hypothetical protein